MSLLAISNLFMKPELMAQAMIRFHMTSGKQVLDVRTWLFVDNHWPLGDLGYQNAVEMISHMGLGMIVDPGSNLGGHGGFNFALKQLNPHADDLILNYDLDSNPLSYGWLSAMIDVMRADPSLGYVALLDDRCVENRPWQFETIAGHKMAFADTDMWNVTLFRASVLREGMKAQYKYYGQVELPMQEHVKSLGMRFGYLYDFRESCPPFTLAHDSIYTQYKADHVSRKFDGSFDEYLKKP